jgi:hypothetical protein
VPFTMWEPCIGRRNTLCQWNDGKRSGMDVGKRCASNVELRVRAFVLLWEAHAHVLRAQA